MDQIPTLILLLFSMVLMVDMQNIDERDWVFSSHESGATTQNNREGGDINVTPKPYVIQRGHEPGICLNITKEIRTKYELRRKSFLRFGFHKACLLKPQSMCYGSHVDYKNEIVPQDHEVNVRTPFCCLGYMLVNDKKLLASENKQMISRSWPDGDIYCQAECNPPCVNGNCTSPNICECSKGMFLLDDGRTCEVPKCDPDCLNADCTGHNICKCHSQYVKHEKKPNMCVPHCSSPCKANSYCSSPDFCKCENGYEPHRDTDECIPVCLEKCVNGICNKPGECKCLEGYSKIEGSENKCEPVCKDCENGVCSAPGHCICNSMYVHNIKTGGCTPQCSPNCSSGCDAPFKCNDCSEGYKRSEISPNRCEPVCSHCNSVHGKCMAPGVCICENGYKRNEDDTDCVPDCINKCINANCSSPNTCNCLEGYRQVSDNVCESNATACKKNISSTMERIHGNGDCFSFENKLQLYTDGCSPDLKHASCYEEFCVDKNSMKVCDMVYKCQFFPGFSSLNALLERCWWSDDNKNKTEKTPNTTVAAVETIPEVQKEMLPLYFFNPHFDISPCLLCLCLANDQRNVCVNESISFRLCSCLNQTMEANKVPEDNLKIPVIAVIGSLLTLGTILLLIVIIKNGKTLMQESQSYTVSAFSNDLYCDSRLEEVEHVYAEIIESDDPDKYMEVRRVNRSGEQ